MVSVDSEKLYNLPILYSSGNFPLSSLSVSLHVRSSQSTNILAHVCQVANAWKMLDDLAETDSAAYKEIQEAAADHLVRQTQL